jgi:chromate reductase, NAD(P)H dehydrogenase (quinone)
MILALCGSNRTGSTNHLLLDVAARLLVDVDRFVIYDGLAQLPHFSPDQDDQPPAPVAAWRDLVRTADAVLVSTPEYAHGLPGTLKNGLDWLVSTTVLENKPTVVWSASPTGGEFVHPQLIEVLRTMSAQVLVGASLQIVGARRMFDLHGHLTDATTEAQLADSLEALRRSLGAALGDASGTAATDATRS